MLLSTFKFRDKHIPLLVVKKKKEKKKVFCSAFSAFTLLVQGSHRTRCNHDQYCSNTPETIQRMFEQLILQSFRHSHRRRRANGCGFSQGLRNGHGWVHFPHEPPLQRESTRCLRMVPPCCSVLAPKGRQLGKRASCNGLAVRCI